MRKETAETEVQQLRQQIEQLQAKISYLHAVNTQLHEDLAETERFRNYWWELATKTRDVDPLDAIAMSVSRTSRSGL